MTQQEQPKQEDQPNPLPSKISLPENWRNWDLDQCQAWMKRESDNSYRRYANGRQEYGPTFVGDPLKQLKEEIVDASFYLWNAERQRLELTERLSMADKHIEQLSLELEQAKTHQSSGPQTAPTAPPRAQSGATQSSTPNAKPNPDPDDQRARARDLLIRDRHWQILQQIADNNPLYISWSYQDQRRDAPNSPNDLLVSDPTGEEPFARWLGSHPDWTTGGPWSPERGGTPVYITHSGRWALDHRILLDNEPF